MKKTVTLLALASLLCLGGTAMANIGTTDAVPAATLLVPRFEVDLTAGPGTGLTTLFSVNNASDESVVAHVTMWTEWWVPVIDFDIYLTGYDVQTINVYDILVSGILPRTGPSESLSPSGLFSAPGGNAYDTFGGSCTTTAGEQPNYNPLTSSFRTLIQQAFSGQPVTAFGGKCASASGNTDIARGYITIDSVSRCSAEFPDNGGYFIDGGNGTANNNNVLWGDYFIVDPANNFAQGFTSVHIEADSVALAFGAGSCDPDATFPYTFYCSLASGGDLPGEDNREALASVWAVRYANGGAFDGGTSVVAWRDPLTGANSIDYTCGTNGPGVSTQAQIVVFDEEENPITSVVGGPSGQPSNPGENPFPWCTNRAQVGTDLSVDSDFGWLYLNLNDNIEAGPFTYNQAYVTVVLSALGRFSVGYDGIQLNGLTVGDGREPNPLLGEYKAFGTPTLTDAPSLNQP